MVRLVKDPANDLLEPFPWGEGQNLLREALLVADHNSHHLGELIVIRRLLDTWPAIAEFHGQRPRLWGVLGRRAKLATETSKLRLCRITRRPAGRLVYDRNKAVGTGTYLAVAAIFLTMARTSLRSLSLRFEEYRRIWERKRTSSSFICMAARLAASAELSAKNWPN